ncbi:MAG: hypothetical protein IPM02_10020 [Betaproteobacteria bacterium]|nr:hypothetical protein [Betaproteobacteria bacterium]
MNKALDAAVAHAQPRQHIDHGVPAHDLFLTPEIEIAGCGGRGLQRDGHRQLLPDQLRGDFRLHLRSDRDRGHGRQRQHAGRGQQSMRAPRRFGDLGRARLR